MERRSECRIDSCYLGARVHHKVVRADFNWNNDQGALHKAQA
jgi:hypothetical protein